MMVKNYMSYCMLKVASMFTVKENHNLVSQEVSEESSEIEERKPIEDKENPVKKSPHFTFTLRDLCLNSSAYSSSEEEEEEEEESTDSEEESCVDEVESCNDRESCLDE